MAENPPTTDDLPELDALEVTAPAIAALDRPIDLYAGLSLLACSREQTSILTEPVDPELVEILPTGEVYMQQVNYRRALNRAFGPGQWGLRPLGPLTMRERILSREWALYVQNHYVSSAIGEAEYFADNDRQTFATASETVKSNALMRCCKDLGIAAECWDRRWADAFRTKYCVQVLVLEKNNRTSTRWRRLNQDPLAGEQGVLSELADAASEKQQEKKAHQTIDAESRPEPDTPAPRAIGPTKPPMPSDVFTAGNLAKWTTKELNAFIVERFGKPVSQLDKGAECQLALAAIRKATADL